MITNEQIEAYLATVPPLPETLRKTLQALQAGELAEAAKEAAGDPALVFYLKKVVNSAAYGFRHELNDVAQIFSALGVQRAKQLLYAYMVSQLAPKAWRYFHLDSEAFQLFQIDLMKRWEELLEALGVEDSYLTAAAVMSAGLVVADAIFAERADDVALLRSMEDLELDTILERVSGLDFQRLVLTIARKWEVDEPVREVVRLAFGKEPCDGDDPLCRLGKMLHLLLFYELSRPKMLESGANAFLRFEPAFAAEVLEDFQKVVPLS